ncbi:leucine-rich repeat extensin-like protein 5 [Homalodisca vitripennis]|uniref:leucine-rich repeat extensin-like protein 5 n=1 Tax=Homalodisca vitripennis TaxID=197043 RepID=UPI001EEBB086|nr:leucine-rich repeat extensin-like protein 5 [Homalodisca vitripennis]
MWRRGRMGGSVSSVESILPPPPVRSPPGALLSPVNPPLNLPLRDRPQPGSPPPPSTPGAPSPPDPPISPREKISPWQREWLARFTPGMEWATFLATLDKLVTSLSPAPSPSRQPRPVGFRPPRPRRTRHDGDRDVREAARIQNLYRTAPKRTMREILEASSPICSIPEEAIMAYFTSSYSAKIGCAVEPPPGCAIPAGASPPPVLDRIEPREVAKMLRKTANTAPGPDGVKYGIWRRRDSTGHVLSTIFNICLAAGRFPLSKVSATVLIHKKGAPDEISNWRPIALSDTAGKLLCSVFAHRLSSWLTDNRLLSWAQKGFTLSEGSLEHNFMLQELLDEGRRRGGELCLAWLDLANAFGSVPHRAVVAALRSASLT